MKLVEILARKLQEWPATTKCFAQDDNSDIYNFVSTSIVRESGEWEGADNPCLDHSFDCPELYRQDLASDHDTAIVTREMWDQERAKLNGIDWSKAPAGATHCNVKGGCIYKWLKDSPQSYFDTNVGGWIEYTKYKGMISHAAKLHFAGAVAKPIEDDGWSGECLPPVGLSVYAVHSGEEQGVCSVKFYGDTFCVLVGPKGLEQCGKIADYKFTPIKTPEQIATEERDAAIKDMKDIAMGSSINHGMLEALYDAGYRKTGE